MTHLGLFEGIGGFSIAARWMGWKTLAWCEWNEFGQKILKKHFPEAEGFGDITKTDFTKYANRVDVLTGGFPCQPYSLSGKRLGKEDSRHLWPEMLRAIKEVQPSWIVGENVSGLLNWNGGLVLDEIKTDLEGAGFEVFPPCVLPACGVNASHRRDRVWIIAHNDSFRQNRSKCEHEEQPSEGGLNAQHDLKPFNDRNANGSIEQRERSQRPGERELNGSNSSNNRQREWTSGVSQSPVRRVDDGVPRKLDESRLMALGNAIVPQVALQIFKAISELQINLEK